MKGQPRLVRSVHWSPQGTGKLNEASAARILDAVGKKLARTDIDKAAMIRGINLCLQWYQNARDFSTNKGLKDRNRRLGVIYNKARALDILLAKDDTWLPLGASPSADNFFRAPIKRLVEVVDHRN
jgi:hypothetical protein